MKINHSIQVDLANPGLPPRLQATQDDSVSHVLALHLKESGKAWPIPADAAVLVQFRKSDRTGGVYDTLPDGSAAWQVRGNVLHITLAPQVLTAPGDTALAVTLIRGESRLTVARILLQVMPSPSFAGTSESYSYVSAFLPQPAEPKVGHMLQVKEVDSRGMVVATESVASGLDSITRTLLLSLLQKALYADDMSTTLSALQERLELYTPSVSLVAIDAVYTGGVVYAGSDVKTLQHITVTAHYSDGTQQQVKNFRLSGVLIKGENRITVTYGDCTDTVTVVAISRPADHYYVYNNLSFTTNSNPATTVQPGESYSCVIRPEGGYDLQRIMITMGEEVVFEENYTTPPLECGWTMKSVTGDIIITAIAQPQVAISHLAVTYTGGSVLTGTKLSQLTGITVTVHYTDGTSQQLTGGYGLYGTIGVGSNIITVSYRGCTADFTVIGTKIPTEPVLKHSWDFTAAIADSIGGTSPATNGTRDSDGLHLTQANQYITLLPTQQSILNKTVEIDIGPGTLNAPSSQHGRIFAVGTQANASNTDAACFTWRYNNTVGWSSYAGNVPGGSWDDALDPAAYPLNFFSGKTLRLAFDSAGRMTLSYAAIGSGEFTTVKTWSVPWAICNGYFMIGGIQDNELFPITIRGVRIYEEE